MDLAPGNTAFALLFHAIPSHFGSSAHPYPHPARACEELIAILLSFFDILFSALILHVLFLLQLSVEMISGMVESDALELTYLFPRRPTRLLAPSALAPSAVQMLACGRARFQFWRQTWEILELSKYVLLSKPKTKLKPLIMPYLLSLYAVDARLPMPTHMSYTWLNVYGSSVCGNFTT
jgi:hypothetical protein